MQERVDQRRQEAESSKPESDDELERQRTRQQRYAALIDGLTAIGNLVMTANGADSVYSHSRGVSSKLRTKWNKRMAQHEKDKERYQEQTRQADQDEYNIARMRAERQKARHNASISAALNEEKSNTERAKQKHYSTQDEVLRKNVEIKQQDSDIRYQDSDTRRITAEGNLKNKEAQLAETRRHNKASEGVAKQNANNNESKTSETVRHNKATEKAKDTQLKNEQNRRYRRYYSGQQQQQ